MAVYDLWLASSPTHIILFLPYVPGWQMRPSPVGFEGERSWEGKLKQHIVRIQAMRTNEGMDLQKEFFTQLTAILRSIRCPCRWRLKRWEDVRRVVRRDERSEIDIMACGIWHTSCHKHDEPNSCQLKEMSIKTLTTTVDRPLILYFWQGR